jgi:hypothetical protein
MKYYRIIGKTRLQSIEISRSMVNSGRVHLIPAIVKKQAQLGLEWQKKHGQSTRENRKKGILRAKQITKSEVLTTEDLVEMAAYFARHQIDKESTSFFDNQSPSNGRIAWQLWGSGTQDEAWQWASKILKKQK